MKNSVKSIFKKSVEYLLKNNIPSAETDVIYLLAHIFNIPLSHFIKYKNFNLSLLKILKLKMFLHRRKNKEPIAYITGHKEFYGFDFLVSKNVLIPRPETEFLVDEILNLPIKNFSLLDICCGAGNIGITIKKLREDIKVTMSDINKKTIKVAKQNVYKILGNINAIKLVQSDMFNSISGKFDVIVSNPPYIRTKNIENLMDDVKYFEPRIALDGGNDGLKFYKTIIKQARNYLNTKGYVVLELNPFLTSDIINILELNNFKVVKIQKDYSELDRVAIAQLKPQ